MDTDRHDEPPDPPGGRPPDVAAIANRAGNRLELWAAFLRSAAARSVVEIGVYRGAFAASMLDQCPGIETYYMIDPWRHLDDWKKPANRDDTTFQQFYEEAMARTRRHEGRRVVLRGRTTEVVDRIPDAGVDVAYIDGDHTLRGISVDLIRVYPKIRDGGWIAGDDFSRSIWQHGPGYEPTMVFPFAVHFAEAVGCRIYALPHRQFLIEKRAGSTFELVDLPGIYGEAALLGQVAPPGASPGAAASPEAPSARELLRRALSRRPGRRSRRGP